jgi:O-methyltransferase
VDAAELYLDLLKRCLTRTLHPGSPSQVPAWAMPRGKRLPVRVLKALLHTQGLDIMRLDARPETRAAGADWPVDAETMIGIDRLDQLHRCVKSVLDDDVPGDLVETGVWRGGATIFMRGALAAYGDEHRIVWAADSFRGLPPPDVANYPRDAGSPFATFDELRIGVEVVKANFARYGLLDDRVRFLVGWFKDTLPTAPIEKISLLRLDGDMYESTMEALGALYSRVSPGGWVIIDDYGAVDACMAATDDYRAANGIDEPMERVNVAAAWRKQA